VHGERSKRRRIDGEQRLATNRRSFLGFAVRWSNIPMHTRLSMAGRLESEERRKFNFRIAQNPKHTPLNSVAVNDPSLGSIMKVLKFVEQRLEGG